MPALRTVGVTKEYDTGSEVVTALENVDFSVDPGEFVSIMGPSGSGKSTMLNVLGLLDSPSDGSVYLDGRDVTDLSDHDLTRERRSSLGFVFQDFHLIPTLTAVENVELPAIFDGETDGRTDRAIDLLQRMGLGDRLYHSPDELSGGQQQRVAIARSLVNSPHILLADEPTGNLDHDTSRQILEEFTRVKTEESVAVVVVTHDEIVNDYADRVVRLFDGRVQ